MNRIGLVVIGWLLVFGLPSLAQQPAPNAIDTSVPAVEGHVKLFTEKLDLTADQQTKIRPILRQMHDATEQFNHDEILSQQERLSQVRAARATADKKIREILNQEQTRKLDELEHDMHPELHEGAGGTAKR